MQNLDRYLSQYDAPIVPEPPAAPRRRYEEIKAFLRTVDAPSADALTYWETHIERIARTLSMGAAGWRTERVLELGAYMQMTPALQCVLGYDEVRGTIWPLGRVDTKIVNAGGKRFSGAS